MSRPISAAAAAAAAFKKPGTNAGAPGAPGSGGASGSGAGGAGGNAGGAGGSVSSQGLPLPYSQAPGIPAGRKETRGPYRTSKSSTKLKVLPTSSTANEEETEDQDDRQGEQGVDGEQEEFYSALAQIPAGSARRDAMRLTKTEKAKLPRVTAYCTAAAFNLPALEKFFLARAPSYRCNPRLFETECLHTPYLPPLPGTSNPKRSASAPRSKHTVPEGDLLGLDHQQVSDPDPAAQLDVSHVPNLSSPPAEEPSSLSLGQHPPPESSIAQSERIKREAQDLNDREVHERRRKHLARRVTGFATKPSGLQAGPPGGKHQNRARGGRGGSDYETASDREDEDDDETWVPDVFIFEYGTVVIWGMTEREEKRMLANLRKFESERLAVEDVEMEDLNFYYANYSRIYNDVITLRKGSSFMTKLSLSHALSQSVKISLYEALISATIEQTKDLPKTLSESGAIGMSRKEIMKQIGSLFILRINWGGSILETPEFFWSYPDLEPLYQAARSYLEITQRIDTLNARVEVLQDMLKLLKESVNSTHEERLETIVIWLIAVEIILGVLTIVVDVFSAP